MNTLYFTASLKAVHVSKELKQTVKSRRVDPSVNADMLELANMLEVICFYSGDYPTDKATGLRPVFLKSLAESLGILDNVEFGGHKHFIISLIQFLDGKQRYVEGELLLSDKTLLRGAKLLKRFGDLLLQKCRRV
jgi:hypothetical protein